MENQNRKSKRVLYMFQTYQIAICDDEERDLEQVGQMLHTYCQLIPDRTFSIRRFQNAKELLAAVETQEYQPDVLMLDIFLAEDSGLTAAKELRNMGYNGKIIFLTVSKEYALEAFGVEAASYLVKPVCEKELFGVLDNVLESLAQRQPDYVLFETDNHVRRLALDDIIYCEAQRKEQYICLKQGDCLLLRMTMARLWERLCMHKDFIKLGVSYIVNMNHIERLDMQMLLLDNGKEIYLPRGTYKDLREKYFDYYFGDRTLLYGGK